MDKLDLIKYWIDTSDQDYITMIHLYESKDFNWSLFIGHLVIEKLLKALYVQNIDSNVPKTHDLLRLAGTENLELTDEQQDTLDIITTFNISARYPDYKQSFNKKCTNKFTHSNIEKIKEMRLWLLGLLTVK